MTNKRQIIVTIITSILLVLLYILIFSFSEQDGAESSSLSQKVSETCVEVVDNITGNKWSDELKKNLAEYFEHPIRKLAHFSEYALMGVLLYILWYQWMKPGVKLYALVVGWVFLSASADEFHQLFVPGRAGMFVDVLLDTAGGFTGLLISIGVWKVISGIVRRRQNKLTAG